MNTPLAFAGTLAASSIGNTILGAAVAGLFLIAGIYLNNRLSQDTQEAVRLARRNERRLNALLRFVGSRADDVDSIEVRDLLNDRHTD